MAMSYFTAKKKPGTKQVEAPVSPVSPLPDGPTISTPGEETAISPMLDDEDQKFLERLAALSSEPEGTPPPLPSRPLETTVGGTTLAGRNAQEALMDGAHQVPLPTSPPEVPSAGTAGESSKAAEKEAKSGRRRSVMSYFSLAQSKIKSATQKDPAKEKEPKDKEKKKAKITEKDKNRAADDLLAAAQSTKTAEQLEAEKEQQDITAILDKLNLSAVNNRVFSFSKESEELFAKFNLVLKDIINGAPTAYHDLEKLFTEYDTQLKKMYGGLPPFLQNLVKSLPAKVTAALGPELLAAQAEKPGFDGKQRAGTKSKRGIPKIPSLKSLISAEGAVATMLRSILQFLKLRFPAVLTGTNVIMSLAVCVLLFVFWYCHKRGRETRLDKERLAAEDAEAAGAGPASSTSSINENADADSIFGDPALAASTAESSRARDRTLEAQTSEPPLVISDGKQPGSTHKGQEVQTDNLPSVKNLPDPASK